MNPLPISWLVYFVITILIIFGIIALVDYFRKPKDKLTKKIGEEV